MEKLILHRGYKGKYLENSLISFENALKENLPFETDVRVSRDGAVFMIHDESLDRLFNGIGKIKDFNSEELVKFRYLENRELGLVSLIELCKLIKKYDYSNSIFMHIKELEDINSVFDVFRDYDLSNIIKFFACDELTLKLIKVIKEKYPEYKVGLHFNDNSTIDKKEFEISDFIWADETCRKNITPDLAKFAHRLSKPIYAISPELIAESVFNADINSRWHELIEAGVDGICTDMPEELMDFTKFLSG